MPVLDFLVWGFSHPLQGIAPSRYWRSHDFTPMVVGKTDCRLYDIAAVFSREEVFVEGKEIRRSDGLDLETMFKDYLPRRKWEDEQDAAKRGVSIAVDARLEIKKLNDVFKTAANAGAKRIRLVGLTRPPGEVDYASIKKLHPLLVYYTDAIEEPLSCLELGLPPMRDSEPVEAPLNGDLISMEKMKSINQLIRKATAIHQRGRLPIISNGEY